MCTNTNVAQLATTQELRNGALTNIYTIKELNNYEGNNNLTDII